MRWPGYSSHLLLVPMPAFFDHDITLQCFRLPSVTASVTKSRHVRTSTGSLMPRIARKGSTEFIAALHRIDLADAPSSCREPPADHDARTRAAIEESRGLIDTEAATAAWDAALRAPEWPGRLGSRGPDDAREGGASLRLTCPQKARRCARRTISLSAGGDQLLAPCTSIVDAHAQSRETYRLMREVVHR